MAPDTEQERNLILIIEDDEDSRFVYGAMLRQNGFDVETATSGDVGLRMAREHDPQAILMDVSIPGMDGWAVTSRLKRNEKTSRIPVIVITAHAFPEDRERSQAVGCAAFLTKPCEPRRVLDEVCRVLGLSPDS